MAEIIIAEQTGSVSGIYFQATVSFGKAHSHHVIIHDPASESDEELLAWYFEESPKHPMVRQTDAVRAVEVIRRYGVSLFGELFGEPSARAEYDRLLAVSPRGVQIVVVGSIAFQRLHWETLFDPVTACPVALVCSISRRCAESAATIAPLTPSRTTRLLLVVSRPDAELDPDYRTIARPVVELASSAHASAAVTILRPPTYSALQQHLEETRQLHGPGFYQIVHLDMHGGLLTADSVSPSSSLGSAPAESRARGYLIFEHTDHGQDAIAAADLASVLRAHGVSVVIINACQSARHIADDRLSFAAELHTAGIPWVLAMGYTVTVSAVRLMMEAFYNALQQGQPLGNACQQARQALLLNKARQANFGQIISLEDWLLPIVYSHEEPPTPLRTSHSAKTATSAVSIAQPNESLPWLPADGFWGRDLDILRIERQLQRHNELLLYGMAGVGKTRLLKHLMAWWRETGWVDRAAYVELDEQSLSIEHIKRELASQLELNIDNEPIETLDLIARLRKHRYLLIFDQLDRYINRDGAARKAEWADPLNELHRMLGALTGSQSFVILAARGKLGAFENETVLENSHAVYGLDSESAGALCRQRLSRQAEKIKLADADIVELIRLTRGHPQSMELMIDALHSPAQASSPHPLLETLHRLSPAEQESLAYLAPFHSAISIGGLRAYLHELGMLVASGKDERFDQHWYPLLCNAIHHGLLMPHPYSAEILCLHPRLHTLLQSRAVELFDNGIIGRMRAAFFRVMDQGGEQLAGMLVSHNEKQREVGRGVAGVAEDSLRVAFFEGATPSEPLSGAFCALERFYRVTHRTEARQRLIHHLLTLKDSMPEELDSSDAYSWAFAIGVAAEGELDLGRHQEAISLYLSALHLGLQLDDWERVAMIHHQLGMSFEHLRQWDDARQHYLTSIEIKAAHGRMPDCARSYHNLGVLERRRQRYAEAAEYFEKAISICSVAKDDRGLGFCYNELGNLEATRKNFQQAINYYSLALLHKKRGNAGTDSCWATQHSLGIAALDAQEWSRAERIFSEALEFFVRTGDEIRQAGCLGSLGTLAMQQKNYWQAKEYFCASLRLFAKRHLSEDVVRRLRDLRDLVGIDAAPDLQLQLVLELVALLGWTQQQVETILCPNDAQREEISDDSKGDTDAEPQQ